MIKVLKTQKQTAASCRQTRWTHQGTLVTLSRGVTPNNCNDNTFSFCTHSSGSSLRIYRASNTARCNLDLPRVKIEKISSLYNLRQLALPDKWRLMDDVRSLSSVTFDACCCSLPLGLFGWLLRSTPPTSVDFMSVFVDFMAVFVSLLGLPRFLLLIVVVTSIIDVFKSPVLRLFTLLLVNFPVSMSSSVTLGGFRDGLPRFLTLAWDGPSSPPVEAEARMRTSTLDADKGVPVSDCTAQFGGRPRRGRVPRASTGTRPNGTCWRMRAPRCWINGRWRWSWSEIVFFGFVSSTSSTSSSSRVSYL